VKISWICWWIANLIWGVLFGVGLVIVWVRDVDAAGVTQTPTLKLIAFSVLIIAFIIPLIIQLVWLIVNFTIGNKKQTKN